MQNRKLGKSNLEVSMIGLGKRSLSTCTSASGGVRSFGFVRAQLMNLISVESKGDFLCVIRLLRIFSG
jgi:hypothetical protein